jgi:hypothetical protein
MSIPEYKGNSNKSKVKTVRQVALVPTKKGESFLSSFIKNDLKTVVSNLITDIVLPSIKNTIVDVVKTGIERAILGDVKRPLNSTKSNGVIPYNSVSKNRNKADHTFDDIILDSRNGAEEVLDSLVTHCRRHGEVSVATLYELVGIPVDYTDRAYGWVSLASAYVIPSNGGFKLKLPKTISLK